MTAPSLRRPPEWMLSGACNGLVAPDLDPWCPDDELPPDVRERLMDAAVDVCRGCRVLSECLEHALAAGEANSVRGGLRPRELRRLAAERGLPRPSIHGAWQHGSNSGYAAHGCRCVPCCAAHTRSVAGWRQQRRWVSPATTGLTVVVHELHLPAGTGRRRAFPGQLYLTVEGIAS